ncbi:sigma factor-like helix-turn-helix DNA-binding protein [Embleya sp. NPDC056575]|uniref:sigma factor-like helix-turn-helix DNA-binding protein n=1 Tax=unclassified Embleya TaxID=2699296 RepID=UPI0036AEAFAC
MREKDNLGGRLTTVVARVSLNMPRSRRTRREDAPEAFVADPTVCAAEGNDPEHQALLADSVGTALLVVLETLAPAERLAFVAHDMFALPFDEIAPIVDRTPTATRQLASRARRRARAARPALLDGIAVLARAPGGEPKVVFGFIIANGRIVGIDLLSDPAYLRDTDVQLLDG